MTRKHDRELAQDRGATTEQLTAAGYVQEAERRMCKGSSAKFHCSNCDRWFDEVKDVSVDTQLCSKCWRVFATGR